MRDAHPQSMPPACRRIGLPGIALAVALIGGAACGGNSNSEVSNGGTKGSGGTGTGGAANGGRGGATSASGGAPGGPGGSSGGGSGACAPRTSFTEASHEVLDVTWPAGNATTAGTGKVHLWGKTVYTVNGTKLSGSLQACGTVLPPASLTALVGGGMILIEIPPAAWDSAQQPKFQIDGSQTGWDAGSVMSFDYAALLGFTIADPATASWPMSYTGITMTTDPDGDMNPGLTSVPRGSGGYVLPPTSTLGALGFGSRADQVYLVIRHVVSAMLTRTSCDEASGPATFTHFDNHVIGCHVSGGSACSASEVKFIDDNRTIYEVTSGTMTTKVVPDGATCADVRAAFPM
ncbi:MAG TPA: hypothetical protein VIU64_00490 [Polyangia bacterium]